MSTQNSAVESVGNSASTTENNTSFLENTDNSHIEDHHLLGMKTDDLSNEMSSFDASEMNEVDSRDRGGSILNSNSSMLPLGKTLDLAETDTRSDSEHNSDYPSQTFPAHSQSSIMHPNSDGEKDGMVQEIVSAAQHGDLEILKYYLTASSANPNPVSPKITDGDGITLVHWAALNNKLNAVKFLVSIGAESDVPAGEMMATPLLWAVRYGHVYVADWLIREAHANVDVIDKTSVGILLAAVFSSNVMMVSYVIWTLNDSPAARLNMLNLVDTHGRTALHWAAYQGDFLTVDILISAGANVDLVDVDGFTPLHWGLVSNSRTVVESLVKAKCDIKARTKEQKSAHDIAADMKVSSMWSSVLKDNNRDVITGERKPSKIPDNLVDLLIFLIPYIFLPLSVGIMSSDINTIVQVIIVLILIVMHQLILKKILLPLYTKKRNSITRTPLFAGVFSSTAFWCIATWLFKLLWNTLEKEGLTNFVFLISSISTVYLFFRTMFANPGIIAKETDENIIKSDVYALIEERKYDTNNFCIYSNVRKPLRSKYCRELACNVARFDHYCPWVNNNIGVRNHKIFFGFVCSLEIAIFAWMKLTLQFLEKIEDSENVDLCRYLPQSMCSGWNNSRFICFLFLWVSVQSIWLSFLFLVQIFQISKGYTTHEFSSTHNHQDDNYFSSIPTDELSVNEKNTGVTDSNISLLLENPNENEDQLVDDLAEGGTFRSVSRVLNYKPCRMVGLDQLLLITKDIIPHKKPRFKAKFDNGIYVNWMDFLFLRRIGDRYSFRTLISVPVEGESNLNGSLVDYYRLYTIPEPV